MFAVALLAGRKAGDRRPSGIIQVGFALLSLGVLIIVPLVPRIDSGWYLVVPLLIAGTGLGLLVSQLNNYTLAPISEERISEAAGVNSAGGSFGLSFGLALSGALMLAILSFGITTMTEDSDTLPADQKQQIEDSLEDDAEVMSDAQLEDLLAQETPEVQDEVIDINDEARDRGLQVALLVPLLAGLLGFANSFRMKRQPDITPQANLEGVGFD
jgi:hypothetical protein